MYSLFNDSVGSSYHSIEWIIYKSVWCGIT